MSNQFTFDRIKQSDIYAIRQSRTIPNSKGAAIGLGIASIVFGIWVLMAIGLTFFFMSFSFICSIVPALMVFFGISMWINMYRRSVDFKNAVTEAKPAIIISKHSRSRGEFSSHHITLEFEDGQRREYLIGNANEVSLVGVGDAGVAYTKLNTLLAFDRVSA